MQREETITCSGCGKVIKLTDKDHGVTKAVSNIDSALDNLRKPPGRHRRAWATGETDNGLSTSWHASACDNRGHHDGHHADIDLVHEVSCGWGAVSRTEAEITDSIVVDGKSVQKTFTFSDTSETDQLVKVNMHLVDTDDVFHHFQSEDVNGKARSEKGPGDAIEFNITCGRTDRKIAMPEAAHVIDAPYCDIGIRLGVIAKNDVVILDIGTGTTFEDVIP